MATKTDQGTKKVCIRLTDSSDLSSIHSSWRYSSCTVSSFFPYQKGKVWIPGFHISSYPSLYLAPLVEHNPEVDLAVAASGNKVSTADFPII